MKTQLITIIFCAFFTLTSCRADIGGAGLRSEAAPDFRLETTAGETITLSSLKGKVSILAFFATWCSPCRREIAEFNRLLEEYKEEELMIVGICLDDIDSTKVKALGIRYPVANQTPEILSSYGPVGAIPLTFVIDKQGFIYKKYIGCQSAAVFREDIKRLLNGN